MGFRHKPIYIVKWVSSDEGIGDDTICDDIPPCHDNTIYNPP
jgi:hypothetical protein